jgi:hypothetical protein
MRYRVHLYAIVRVEHELEAASPADAVLKLATSDLHLYQRFDRPGQEYADDFDKWVLVHPLTDNVDSSGRLEPDFESSKWLEVTGPVH